MSVLELIKVFAVSKKIVVAKNLKAKNLVDFFRNEAKRVGRDKI